MRDPDHTHSELRPGDQNGEHDVGVCTAADGQSVTISGLLHTGVQDGVKKVVKKPKKPKKPKHD